MPNLCWNRVRIVGHKSDLDLFEKYALSFEHFYPRPSNDNSDICEWSLLNWGTKWEYDPESYRILSRTPNSLVVCFETAWQPPLRFFEHLLKKFPRCWVKVEFQIDQCEEGVWVAYCKDGEIKDRSMFWLPPDDTLTTDGQILIPEFEE